MRTTTDYRDVDNRSHEEYAAYLEARVEALQRRVRELEEILDRHGIDATTGKLAVNESEAISS